MLADDAADLLERAESAGADELRYALQLALGGLTEVPFANEPVRCAEAVLQGVQAALGGTNEIGSARAA